MRGSKAREEVSSLDPPLFLWVGTCRAAGADSEKGRVGFGEGILFPPQPSLPMATQNDPTTLPSTITAASAISAPTTLDMTMSM